jgi:hypothetical protein
LHTFCIRRVNKSIIPDVAKVVKACSPSNTAFQDVASSKDAAAESGFEESTNYHSLHEEQNPHLNIGGNVYIEPKSSRHRKKERLVKRKVTLPTWEKSLVSDNTCPPRASAGFPCRCPYAKVTDAGDRFRRASSGTMIPMKPKDRLY